MHILLHAEPPLAGIRPLAEHLETSLRHWLGRFGERVTRVEAHLAGVGGRPRLGEPNVDCRLEARLANLEAVVVNERADGAHHAIDGGVRKLKRAVGAAISRHDPRHPHAADAG